jgi:hypothetical protein
MGKFSGWDCLASGGRKPPVFDERGQARSGRMKTIVSRAGVMVKRIVGFIVARRSAAVSCLRGTGIPARARQQTVAERRATMKPIVDVGASLA